LHPDLLGPGRIPVTPADTYGRHASVCGVVSPPTTLPFSMITGPIDETPCVQRWFARPEPAATSPKTTTAARATASATNALAPALLV